MSDTKLPDGARQTGRTKSTSEQQRAIRQAESLRANLQRRKGQTRIRQPKDDEVPSESPESS